MMSKNDSITTKFIFGLLLGAGLGGLTYFLYKTPKGKQVKEEFASTLSSILQELDSQEEDLAAGNDYNTKAPQKKRTFKRVKKFFHRQGRKLN